jgi:hypothetical protein
MFEGAFTLIVVFIIGVIVYAIVKWYKEWSWNNKQPVLNVPVTVVAKRDKVNHRRSMHHNNHHHFSSSTSYEYYVTFEFSSRRRVEFDVSEEEYGLIVENDKGTLTFQGTRFISFVRI